MIGVKVVVKDGASPSLKKLLANAKDKQAFLSRAGKYMVATEVPRVFRQGGPPGQAWAPPKMRRGKPLRDTGLLLGSIAWRANTKDVVIGTQKRYAPTHQYGATIVPGAGKKWLAIPLSPPLSEAQRQTAKPRDFAGAFVLISGPEGPGLYRKAKGAVIASDLKSGGASKYSKRGGAKGIERIFAFVRSVKIPKRPFLVWTQRSLADIEKLWVAMLTAGVSGVKKGA